MIQQVDFEHAGKRWCLLVEDGEAVSVREVRGSELVAGYTGRVKGGTIALNGCLDVGLFLATKKAAVEILDPPEPAAAVPAAPATTLDRRRAALAKARAAKAARMAERGSRSAAPEKPREQRRRPCPTFGVEVENDGTVPAESSHAADSDAVVREPAPASLEEQAPEPDDEPEEREPATGAEVLDSLMRPRRYPKPLTPEQERAAVQEINATVARSRAAFEALLDRIPEAEADDAPPAPSDEVEEAATPVEDDRPWHASAAMGLGPLCGAEGEDDRCMDGSVSPAHEDGRDITCTACRAVWLAEGRAGRAEARAKELEQATPLSDLCDALGVLDDAFTWETACGAVEKLRERAAAAPGAAVPGQPPQRHWEVYVGPPRAAGLARAEARLLLIEHGAASALRALERLLTADKGNYLDRAPVVAVRTLLTDALAAAAKHGGADA